MLISDSILTSSRTLSTPLGKNLFVFILLLFIFNYYVIKKKNFFFIN